MKIYLYLGDAAAPFEKLLSHGPPRKQHPSYIFKRLSQHKTFLNIPYFCPIIHRNRDSLVTKQDSILVP